MIGKNPLHLKMCFLVFKSPKVSYIDLTCICAKFVTGEVFSQFLTEGAMSVFSLKSDRLLKNYLGKQDLVRHKFESQ